jgi:hypothetical protein
LRRGLPGFFLAFGVVFLVGVAPGLTVTVAVVVVLVFFLALPGAVGLALLVVLAVAVAGRFRMAGRLGLGRRGAQDQRARAEAQCQDHRNGDPLLLADAFGQGGAFLCVHGVCGVRWISARQASRAN